MIPLILFSRYATASPKGKPRNFDMRLVCALRLDPSQVGQVGATQDDEKVFLLAALFLSSC